MDSLLSDIHDHYEMLWYDAYSESKKTLGSTTSYTTRKENDKALICIKKDLICLLEHYNVAVPPHQQINTSSIKDKVIHFATKHLDLPSHVCATLDDEKYYEVTQSFIHRAKSLKANLTFSDLNQALRNMWVIIALQIYYGEAIQLTDASFAYSMLYPLTDNYIDDQSISSSYKADFNQRLLNKIARNEGHSENQEEAMIFHMIDLIASDYNREDYPNLWKSILSILDAQNKSLDQHNLHSPFSIDLLQYTFYKGGASVLADAYIVKGDLAKDEALFAYGYGTILQMADDLEDIDADQSNNHSTVCTVQAKQGVLDSLLRHYKAYLDKVFLDHYQLESSKQKALACLLTTSLDHLLMSAVYKNSHHYSKDFLNHFEKENRFSKKAYKKLNRKICRIMSNDFAF